MDPILLLGTTHASSHFPVASSTTAQIGNPILYNLSWPSPAQRSWMPIGTFLERKILLALGSRNLKPASSCICITSDTKSLVKCCSFSKAIFAWIVRTPCRFDGSLSIWSRTSCSASCRGILLLRLPLRPSSLRRRLTVMSLSNSPGPTSQLDDVGNKVR